MSADQVSRLHEQASEHYLNGDYTAALASWREVLALDPGNEEAREGARMAAQFAAEQTAPTASEPPADEAIEHDVDLRLKVLDSLGASSAPVAFELGDPSQVDAAPLTPPAEEGWEPPAAQDASGLAPASATVDASGAPTAAAVELRRRVDDLLAQARSKLEAGERDEALAILARVSILDEENAEAVTIRAELEASGRTDLDRIEQSIIEGVSALESGRLDEAERLFQEVLSLSPEHREALHYMEQVTSRRAAAANPPPAAPAEDLLEDAAAFGAPSGPAATPEPAVIPVAAKPRPSRSLPPSMPDLGRPLGRGFSFPLKKLLYAGIAAGAAYGAYVAYPLVFDRGSAPAPPAPSAAASRPQAGAAVAPAPSPAGKPAPPTADRSAAAALSIEKGKRLADAGDYAGAVVAYNEAVTLDPTNLDARAGLASAGARYKAQKSDQDAVKVIENFWAEGDYQEGLRLAYRLPATIDAARIEQIKTAGWYNLAIIALRAGDTRGALTNLDEALAIDASDVDARKLKDFTARYADIQKDRAYLDAVEAMPFRRLP